jgi:CRISPR/Cas system-associated endonuclease/helicase Cas3
MRVGLLYFADEEGAPGRALKRAVGTIDQAMLSQLRTRHSWLRAWCLARQLLVIDEVHASDPYMSEIITRLVKEHLMLGGYALLMSATLGETLTDQTRATLPC